MPVIRLAGSETDAYFVIRQQPLDGRGAYPHEFSWWLIFSNDAPLLRLAPAHFPLAVPRPCRYHRTL